MSLENAKGLVNKLSLKAKPAASPAPASQEMTTARLTPNFYNDQFYSIVLLTLLVMILSGVIVLWSLYERTLAPSSQYFPTTADGKLVAPLPLSQPNLATPALLQWSVEAITSAYTFNFVNYQKSLQDARYYFTKDGYRYYLKSLSDNNIVEDVVQKKYVISVAPTSAPIILREKPTVDGSYAWEVQLPIQVSFHSAKEEAVQYYSVVMIITRVSTDESTKGVAIAIMSVRKARAPL